MTNRILSTTSIFVALIITFKALCLLCIMVISYDSVKEWVKVLPIHGFTFLSNMVTLAFVVFISLMIWLSTDRSVYMLSILIRSKSRGLKNIWGESADIVTYIGQAALVLVICINTIQLSLYFSKQGAKLQLLKDIPDISVNNFAEISEKFQNKKEEVEKYYDALKAKEERKYNKLVSYKSVELAQQAIIDLEQSKQRAIIALEKSKDLEVSYLNKQLLAQEAKSKEKAKQGNYIGLSFELLAVVLSIASQILLSGRSAKKKSEISEIQGISVENSNEISAEIIPEEIEKLISSYYDSVGKGKQFATQKELANFLKVSEVKVSRVFSKEKKKRIFANEYSIGSNMGW